jgi:hypothetical protein
MFIISFTPGVTTLFSSEEPKCEQRVFTLRNNFTLREQISPLEANFTPGGQVCS